MEMANEVIRKLDIAQETRPLSDAESALHKQLKLHLLGWATIERSRRRQCSRLIQIREGDACTKFFHQRAKGRRRHNLITYLKNEVGELIWKHDDKASILHKYFLCVLGKTSSRSHTINWDSLNLSRIDSQDLDRPFTLEELKHTVDEMPAEKAPGPDGFSGLFYKKCWDIIKFDVLAAMNSFHDLRAGPLHKMNGANIILIPKLDMAEQPKDYRPISLIHSFGKLITKTLALRLRPLMNQLISTA